jgi:chaperonin GroES
MLEEMYSLPLEIESLCVISLCIGDFVNLIGINMTTMVKIRPLHDRIAVEALEREEKTAGGIIIPDTAKEKPMQGKVVAVGDGAKDESGKRIPMDIKVGDKVLFGKWSGTEVEVGGSSILIMKESDVMAVLV